MLYCMQRDYFAVTKCKLTSSSNDMICKSGFISAVMSGFVTEISTCLWFLKELII